MKSGRPLSIALILSGVLIAGTGSAARIGTAQGAAPAAVPSPEAFFGFQMGADRKLANWDRLLEYYRVLAKSSAKLRLVELGKTSEGRPYVALFISHSAS